MVGTMKLPELKAYAETLGLIVPTGADRATVIMLVRGRLDEIESLRLECANLGLDTTGEENALRVRLASAKASVKPGDRILYRWVGVGAALLGFVVLAVSLPHLAGVIAKVTGQSIVFGVLLAIAIDTGSALLKLADILASKFDLSGKVVYLRIGQAVTLSVAALLNAVGFIKESAYTGGSEIGIGIAFAVFLSAAVWGFWALAGFMLTNEREAPKADAEVIDEVSRLRAAADELERLQGIGKSV